MKKLYVMFICLLAIPLFAIQVSGTQSGTWTSDNNPYEVMGDITVPTGQTLTLESGVEVLITGAYQITVEGLINVNGTETDSVRIQPISTFTGFWDGIRMEWEGTGSFNTFNYCYIKGGAENLHSINSPLQVFNSRIDSCDKGIDIFAIGAATPAEIHIADSIIENCVKSGIEITENSNVLIENNIIRYNGTGAQYRGAIQIGIQSTGVTCSPTISNNTIINNHKQGIICTDMLSAGIIDAQILDNDIRENLTGIYFYNCEGTVIGNTIEDNYITGDTNSGAGIMCYGSRAIPYISRNTLQGNYTAVYAIANSNPNLGNFADSSHPVQGLNHFGDNFDPTNNNNSIYTYQSTGGTIYAQNNFWISEDPIAIGATIHDSNDVAGLPTVVFDPIASNSPIQIEVNVTIDLDAALYDDAWLSLVPLQDDSEEFDYMLTGSEMLSLNDITSGAYILKAIAYSETEGVVGLAVYGTQLEPTIIEVTDDMETLEIDLDVTDEFLPRFLAIGQQTDEFTVTANAFISGMEFVAEPYYQYFYQDGDYLSVAGEKYWDNSWIFEEYNVVERKFFKTQNTGVNDSWSMLDDYDANDGASYYTAEIIYQDLLDVLGNTMQADVIYVDYQDSDSYYYLVDGFGLARFTAHEGDYYAMGFHISDAVVTTDGTSFPIVEGNIWYYDELVGQSNPWDLHLRADIGLVWEAPYYTGYDFEGYRIYENGTLIDEVDFSTRSYEYPFPVDRTPTSITVTAYDANFETEPSNVLDLSFMGIDTTPEVMPVASLNGNYPNPFNPETNISFTVADASVNTVVSIYNIRGEKVNTLVNSKLPTGNHSFVWNGRDQNGQAVSSGVYFCKMSSGGFSTSRKLILMK